MSPTSRKALVRRSNLEQQGFEFDNRKDPKRIFMILDIPEAIYSAGHANAYDLIRKHLSNAMFIGYPPNPFTELDDRNVRLVLTYHLSDADDFLPENEQTPDFIFSRVSELVEDRRRSGECPCDLAYRQRCTPDQPLTIQRLNVWEATRYH